MADLPRRAAKRPASYMYGIMAARIARCNTTPTSRTLPESNVNTYNFKILLLCFSCAVKFINSPQLKWSLGGLIMLHAESAVFGPAKSHNFLVKSGIVKLADLENVVITTDFGSKTGGGIGGR